MVIEQPKACCPRAAAFDVHGAFILLREYARSHNQKLSELASQVVHDREFVQQVIRGHAREDTERR